MDKLEKIIRDELKEIDKFLAKGKGTWPQNDYVRDCDWDWTLGKRSALIYVLEKAGVNTEEFKYEQ